VGLMANHCWFDSGERQFVFFFYEVFGLPFRGTNICAVGWGLGVRRSGREVTTSVEAKKRVYITYLFTDLLT
jgi:hypothetical protein